MIKRLYNNLKFYIRQTDIWALFFVFVESSRMIGFMPAIPSFAFYGILVLYSLYSIGTTKKTDISTALILAYIPLEILIAHPLDCFNPWGRYLMLSIIFLTSTSMLQSERLRNNRRRIFEISCGVCAFIGVGSFFARFLGINYMVMTQIDLVNNVGLFSGLTTHSMLLGPMAGVGTVFLMRQAFYEKTKIWWVLCAMSLISVLFAASRSAFLATLGAMMVFIYLRSNNAGALVKYILAAFLAVAVTMPIWEGAMGGLMQKQQNNIEAGGTFSSREDKWNQRIEEFKSSPVIGYGFVSVDPTAPDESFDPTMGTLEPGSSWLSALSMLGIVGFALIVLIYKNAFVQVYVRDRDPYLTSILALFTVNMCTEGYIFFGGSFLCFMFWLTIGVCTDRKYRPQQVGAKS